MDKLKQESVDMTEQNIDKIGAMFPNVITETKDENGNLKKAINFTLLKQMLSKEVVDGDECYEFTWVGKKQSIIEGNTPIRKTLRPCKEESKEWDKTENLYIEGDNLEVLKLLQGSYLNSIKMIYIDPPYNTGNDFVYRDNFASSKEEYDEESGLFDEEENRLFKNSKTNGRYHSDWCSMMYPRLQLARNLLTEDGVIFISIDDNEVDNLRKICDEVFGEENFIANIIWEKKYTVANDAKFFSDNHDHILVCCKSIDLFNIGRLPRTDEMNAAYKNPDNHPKGLWKSTPLQAKSGSDINFKHIFPNGVAWTPPAGRFSAFTHEALDELYNGNEIWFGKDGKSIPSKKTFLTELKNEGVVPRTIFSYKDAGHNHESIKELKDLFSANLFDNPKPTKLLKLLMTIANTDTDSIILDFFSGSATTAHAVMQLNVEDGGNRKFICVQLPEDTDVKSEAYKAGYKNICEIGKERIRRAGAKIEEELAIRNSELNKKGSLEINFDEADNSESSINNYALDTGFRVLKLDTTNMKDVYYSASEYSQQMLLNLESNIKVDRTDLDLLFGVLVDWGVPLSLPLETKSIEGKAVHFVNDTDLVACFEESISESLIREVAKARPMRVVFRDSSFANSPDKINVTEIFKTVSPDTTIKVI
ncbi:MAG: site-specific DNA-methyltransferase [Bacteroidales bacterium]